MIGRTGEVRDGDVVYAYVNEYESDGDQERQQDGSCRPASTRAAEPGDGMRQRTP